MIYATVSDIEERARHVLSDEDAEYVGNMLEDAAVIIDAFNENAKPEAKKVVSCNMVIRILGTEQTDFPVGATQGTVSGMGFSQTWTMSQGSSGELYLTKIDKKLLGTGNRLGFANILGVE